MEKRPGYELLPTPPRIHSILPAKIPLLLRPQRPTTTLTPPLPPTKPHHQTRSIITSLTRLRRKTNQILGRLRRRLRFLNHIHDLLICQVATDPVTHEHEKAVTCGRDVETSDLRFSAHADPFGSDVAEGASVGQALHALLSPAAFTAFESAIAARETAGQTQRSDIRGIHQATIEGVEIADAVPGAGGRRAAIECRFVSDQVSVLTGANKEPLTGTDAVTELADTWVFERYYPGEASWRLAEARSA